MFLQILLVGPLMLQVLTALAATADGNPNCAEGKQAKARCATDGQRIIGQQVV
jgi:hypothetical protein